VNERAMLSLSPLAGELAVCRLSPGEGIPSWADVSNTELLSITRTPDELSIVAPAALVPAGVRAERGWRALAVNGPLDFGEVGILARLAAALAAAGVSIFVVSTFDTDLLLVKRGRYADAVTALRADGCIVAEGSESTAPDAL
jgi:hypothetical protein